MRKLVALAWHPRGWIGRLLRVALAPAAVLYWAAVRLRALRYRLRLGRRRRLAAAVVSVGNLVVGGTGKTPTALWIAEELRRRGYHVAILSRGYGGSARRPKVVGLPEAFPGLSATLDWKTVGDETVLLARRFAGPVIVARRRAEAGALACRELGAEVLVLDDGFQHFSLARQFDLVCVRGGSALNRSLLPAGPFREPLSALKRAHAVLLTKVDAEVQEPRLERKLRGRPVFRGNLRPICLVTPSGGSWRELPLGLLAGRRALAVTGIADPLPFYKTLQEWEARLEDFLEFPDHHPYGLEDWKKISLRSRDLDLVVTTEKDLVKLEHFPFAKEKLVGVRVAMEVEGGERLMDSIVQAIQSNRSGAVPRARASSRETAR